MHAHMARKVGMQENILPGDQGGDARLSSPGFPFQQALAQGQGGKASVDVLFYWLKPSTPTARPTATCRIISRFQTAAGNDVVAIFTANPKSTRLPRLRLVRLTSERAALDTATTASSVINKQPATPLRSRLQQQCCILRNKSTGAQLLPREK